MPKLKSFKKPSIIAAGYVGTSVVPKVLGYKDEEGSAMGRATAIGSGAITSAISSRPTSVLPKPIRKAILAASGRKSYRRINKYAPFVGAAWGATSGFGSYEVGRAAKKVKENPNVKKRKDLK